MNAAITALLAGLRARTWHGGATLRLHNESCEAILALLRRDWAVRVLDRWSAPSVQYSWECLRALDSGWYCRTFAGSALVFAACGDTAEAARLAAAEAVWPELPADVRAELGERP